MNIKIFVTNLLVIISLIFPMYACESLCSVNGEDLKRCKTIGNQEIDAIVTNYQKTMSGIHCRRNYSSNICQYINDSMGNIPQNTSNETCGVIESERMDLKFLYVLVHNDIQISRFKEYFQSLTRGPIHKFINYSEGETNQTIQMTRFQGQEKKFSLYMRNLTSKLSANNCQLHIIFFIFPNINHIIQYPTGKIEKQLAAHCNVSKAPSVSFYQSQNLSRTLDAMIKKMRYNLENQCSFNYSNNTKETKHTETKKTDSDGTSVTVLVPIVIVGFIVFSCILTMRFCSEGESTLMMRAKIMKYQPEKDKQLLALIYQQIQKEGKPQIEPRTYSDSSNIKISKKPENKMMDRGVFASQPCCSKDVFRGPLVSTIACGLAPLKKATV